MEEGAGGLSLPHVGFTLTWYDCSGQSWPKIFSFIFLTPSF